LWVSSDVEWPGHGPGFLTARGTSIEDTKLSWFSTARGRIGVTEGPWLFYGTAGLAVGEIRESISLAVTTGTFATTVLSTSNSNTGHIVRAGLNYHFNAGQ
jgi:outer membrane immunogenic protein